MRGSVPSLIVLFLAAALTGPAWGQRGRIILPPRPAPPVFRPPPPVVSRPATVIHPPIIIYHKNPGQPGNAGAPPDAVAPPPADVQPPAPVEPMPAPVANDGWQGGPDRPAAAADATGYVIGFVVVAGLVAFCIFVVMAARAKARSAGRILVTAVPPGEAPEEVRRAWVGLELPLARGEKGARSAETVGVVSEQAEEPSRGFAVEGAQAVAILAAQRPDAAAWWRANAPQVAAPGYQLVFDSTVCEQVA